MDNGVKEIILEAIYYFYYFLTALIFIRCILSWFPINGNNFICRFIYNITEPILGPIRRLIEKSPIGGSMIDISPIVAYIFLQILFTVLCQIIVRL